MKKIIALIVVCIMMFSFTGCEKKDDVNTLDIFYLNIDATATVPEKYELSTGLLQLLLKYFPI